MHTPGPWTIEEYKWDDKSYPAYECDFCNYMGHQDGDKVIIIKTTQSLLDAALGNPRDDCIAALGRETVGYRRITEQNYEANAQLIVSAPKMYNALNNIKRKMDKINFLISTIDHIIKRSRTISRKIYEEINEIYDILEDGMPENLSKKADSK